MKGNERKFRYKKWWYDRYEFDEDDFFNLVWIFLNWFVEKRCFFVFVWVEKI